MSSLLRDTAAVRTVPFSTDIGLNVIGGATSAIISMIQHCIRWNPQIRWSFFFFGAMHTIQRGDVATLQTLMASQCVVSKTIAFLVLTDVPTRKLTRVIFGVTCHDIREQGRLNEFM